MVSNRFISLAPDDPDNSDTDSDQAEPDTTGKPPDETSAASEDTLYYDVNDDTPYFLAGTEPPPREQWEVAKPIDFRNIDGVRYLSCPSNGCSFQLHQRD